MLNLIYSLEPILKNDKPSIFLAGPSYRVNNDDSEQITETSWRTEAIKFFQESNYSCNIIIPEFRYNKLPEDFTYSRQVSWEAKGLENADIIIFWIPRDKDTLPGFTTNIELGMYLKSEKVTIGFPENSYKNQYIKEKCSQLNIPIYSSLKETIVNAILKNKKKQVNRWFTSDTHFSEERTMQLSKRPFNSINEMDWTMIKNWNTTVKDNDVVYHLGDFGNPKMIKHLKGQIVLVAGNYDRPEVIEQLKKEAEGRLKIIPEGFEVIFGIDVYSLVHYPSSMIDKNMFYLFGHVHALRTMSKGEFGTGLNVGVDVHNFKPISLADVVFYKTAILNHYDHEVFPVRK